MNRWPGWLRPNPMLTGEASRWDQCGVLAGRIGSVAFVTVVAVAIFCRIRLGTGSPEFVRELIVPAVLLLLPSWPVMRCVGFCLGRYSSITESDVPHQYPSSSVGDTILSVGLFSLFFACLLSVMSLLLGRMMPQEIEFGGGILLTLIVLTCIPVGIITKWVTKT